MTDFGSMSECRTLPPGIEEIANLTITDNAAKAHNEIFTWLLNHGWHGTKEAPMAYDMGDKIHHGRIDIVVEKDNYHLAIEIDRKTPRKKSVKQVKRRGLYGCGLKMSFNPSRRLRRRQGPFRHSAKLAKTM